jgi:serine/threonine protein kinase
MHNTKKIAHKDIKFENLVLDSDFNLKLIDFGFAEEYTIHYSAFEYAGTERYLAPEILQRQLYDGEKADVFAAGVILFNLVLGFPPFFVRADKFDKFYKFFLEKKGNLFWHTIFNKLGGRVIVTDTFINLINNMLEPD